ncbi:MAG: hypothetical protein ACQUHE_06625 [Bacteroidia bacterium]
MEQKSDSVLNGGSRMKVLRHYYVAKGYRSSSPSYSELDSIALKLGRSIGRDYDMFWVNFFSSSKQYKKDSVFFVKSDSLTLVKKRKNLVNYYFRTGFFREKQIIKDGKVLPPFYEDVKVAMDSIPKTYFVN